eukprot:366278-Chlamydomonas_euryale.AAC.1
MPLRARVAPHAQSPPRRGARTSAPMPLRASAPRNPRTPPQPRTPPRVRSLARICERVHAHFGAAERHLAPPLRILNALQRQPAWQTQRTRCGRIAFPPKPDHAPARQHHIAVLPRGGDRRQRSAA